jgi:CheY-like chemotaxis protein
MSGFEVLRQLKANPATSEIPVVIVTSVVLTAEDRQSLTAHVAAVLSKEVLSQPDAGVRIRSALQGMAREREVAGLRQGGG